VHTQPGGEQIDLRADGVSVEHHSIRDANRSGVDFVTIIV
jgi:hypothetical protein